MNAVRAWRSGLSGTAVFLVTTMLPAGYWTAYVVAVRNYGVPSRVSWWGLGFVAVYWVVLWLNSGLPAVEIRARADRRRLTEALDAFPHRELFIQGAGRDGTDGLVHVTAADLRELMLAAEASAGVRRAGR